MAKKEKLTLDDFDLDKELDFDFSIDNIDDDINPQVKNKKDRSPIKDVYKGSISGAKSKLKDPAFITKTIKSSLPKQYGEVVDAADKVTSSLSSLYDDTIREIKPEMARLAKKVDRLIPEERKFFKKISERFTKLVGNEFSDYKSATKEQLQEQSIASSIAAVFDAQNKANEDVKAREVAEDNIKDGINQKRFTSQFNLINSINEGIGRLSNYNDKINQAYQKKSLELQYRNYFVQSELLQNTNKYFEIFKNQNEAITKNTSLPEFVKIKDSEKFKEIAKNKFFGSVQQGLFGDSNIVNTAIKRLKSQTKSAVDSFKYGLEMTLMGLDGIESVNEARKDMAEFGDAESNYSIGGNVLGSLGVDALGAKLGKKIRSGIPEDSPLSRFGYKAANFLKAGSGNVNKLKQSEFIQNNLFAGGVKGAAATAANFGLDLFRQENPNLRVKESVNMKDLDGPAPGVTNRTLKSINDIIPGYLARIYREIAIMRTGALDTPLTMYDFTKDKFSNNKELSTDIKNLLSNKVKSSRYTQESDSFINKLIGDTKFSDDDEVHGIIRNDVSKLIKKLAYEDIDFSPESIRETSVYNKSPGSLFLNKILTDKITNSDEKEKAQYQLTSGFKSLRDTTPDLRSEIELFIKAGYGDILKEQGLVKEDKNGSLVIDFDKYKSLIGKESVVSSDINVKRDIKSINPKDALEAVKKTRIYDWFYKLGKGDQIKHTGPMAQDVKANLGETAAPGGTKIDLTTMNGVNMAAIQELHNQQSKHIKSDSSKTILEAIKKDTSKIVKLMSKGGSSRTSFDKDNVKEVLESRKGFFNSVIEPTIQGAFGAISKIFGVSKDTLNFGKDKIAKPLVDFIGKFYKDNKGTAKDTLGNLFNKGIELATGVIDFSKDLVFNKLPTSFKSAIDIGKNIKDQIVSAIQGPMDIFVKGMPDTPILQSNLMKMGYYIDSTTGKVIKSIEDIKGPVKNRLGEVVLSVEQISQGLVDKNGKDIKTVFEKLTKAVIDKSIKGFDRVRNFYSNLASGAMPDKLKDLFSRSSSSSMKSDKVYDILVEIRDILKNNNSSSGTTETTTEEDVDETNTSKPNIETKYKTGGSGSLIGSLFNSGKSFLGKTKNKKFGLLKGLFGGSDTEPEIMTTTTAPTSNDTDSDDNVKTVKTVKHAGGTGKATFNDRDASGRRDGDWRDRLDAIKEKAINKKDHFLKADLTSKYRSSENVIDMLAKKASDLISGLSSGTGSLLESVGSTVAEGFGLGKLGGLAKKLPGKLLGVGKSAIGVLGKGLGLAKKVGTPILSGLKAIKNVGVASRIVSAAGMARNILTIGSLATAGAASTIMGAAATGLTALGSILASPVVLGTAAVAATAYGAYKAYKYLTRDKIDVYESIRLKQYGLNNSERDQHHNHQLLQLESYLQDGRIGYENGKAFLLPKKIDLNEMVGIFDLDADDTESINNYTRWFEYRFKPFFLNNVTALFSINNKIKLDEISKLSTEEQIKYLSLISFDSGPYDVQVSPFKDIDALNTDARVPLSKIDEAMDILKKKINDKPNTPLDRVKGIIKSVKTLRDPDYWDNKAKEASKFIAGIKERYNDAKDFVSNSYERTKQATTSAYNSTKEMASKAYDTGKQYVQSGVKWSTENIVQPIKNSLAGLIQRAESGSKGYNAYNRGTAGGRILGPVGDRDLTSMSLSQILEDSKRSKDDPQRLFAVGKYQMIPSTLMDAIKRMRIDPTSTLFDPNTQEKLFSDYLLDIKRPKIAAFIKGKSDDSNAAINDAASEWASLPDPKTGVSKYGSGNKSSVSVPTLLSSLTKSRNLYKEYIASGMPEREAYQKAVSSDGPATPTTTTDNKTTTNVASTTGGGYTGSITSTQTKEPTSPIMQASFVPKDTGTTGSPLLNTGDKPKESGTSSDISMFNPPQPATPMFSTPKANTDMGQGFNIGGLESGINHVGETLDKSLNVQQQILNTLQEILSNVNPENLQQIQQGLKQVADKSKPVTEVPTPGINLKRSA